MATCVWLGHRVGGDAARVDNTVTRSTALRACARLIACVRVRGELVVSRLRRVVHTILVCETHGVTYTLYDIRDRVHISDHTTSSVSSVVLCG